MSHIRLSRRQRARGRLLLASSIALACSPAALSQQSDDSQPRASLIDEILVTAQRREQSVQDVPIAVSAFSATAMEDRQIVSTSDIQMNAPNVSYTNTNFGGSNLSIRGIGTLLIAASADSGVSVHMNDVAMSTNLPANEFFDMERVEILRGPQGTLFGRNATGGVMNMITAKPNFDGVSGNVDLEMGNYNHQRLKGVLNLPVTDSLALRFAGMTLERDGYTDSLAHGIVPGAPEELDDRDLHAFRITGLWDLNENVTAWGLYSRFKEDDNRLRITNQVCKATELPTLGCEANEFGTERPHVGTTTGGLFGGLIGALPLGVNDPAHPEWELAYPQRPDNVGLREQFTDFDPTYRYTENTFTGGIDFRFEDYTVGLLGGYQRTNYLTQQDYSMDAGLMLNGINGNEPYYPVSDVSGGLYDEQCNLYNGTLGVPGGCILSTAPTDRFFSYDQSNNESKYWTVELKVRSELEGPFNFQIGANYAKNRSSGDYYVVSNSLDMATLNPVPAPLNFPRLYPGVFDSHSSGPGYEFETRSVFGEAYFDVSEDLRLTAGLRYNKDEKTVQDSAILYNSLSVNDILGGALGTDPQWMRSEVVNYLFAGMAGVPEGTTGRAVLEYHDMVDAASAADQTPFAGPADFPALLDRLAVAQQLPLGPEPGETRATTGSPNSETFSEVTGRIGFDWQATPETMIYGFYSRGYKPGGFNPPLNPDFPTGEYPFTFDNEKIHAFELGAKNSLLNGSMVLNGAAFYYDYDGLQIGVIQQNSAINENIDAEIYGAELEMMWRPEQMENLQIDLAYSWLQTKIDNGTTILDPLNRTQGDDSLVTLKSVGASNTGVNYVANREDVISVTQDALATGNALTGVDNSAVYADGTPIYFVRTYLQQQFDAGNIANAPSDGVAADVGGNELPTSPDHTIRLGAAYTFNLEAGSLTPRWDYYWQSKAYGREFNTPGDSISAWDQHNASLMFETHDGRWMVRAFVRNVFDDDNVTGHYLTSDTSGFFRNYFLTEPRIFGAAVRVNF